MEDEQIKENKDQEDGGSSYADQDNEEGFDKEDLQCRFYREEWPSTEELVVVSQTLKLK
jgi:hypothetical protein